ncbi:MAG: tetratricopeptide repeat protein [Janthinobacterium lividum]
MKKAFLASMLAATCVSMPMASALAQAAPAAQGAAAGPQLSQEEYTAYNAVITATDAAAKATAAEAFLTKYPQSSVKSTVLEQLLAAYAQANNAPKALEAADRLLQVDPNNIRALALQTSLLKSQGDTATDPAAKQTAYDKAADAASRGLKATKPAAVADADWAAIQKQVIPYFYSAIGIDALTKKDSAGAIAAYTSELKAVDPAQTTQPGPFLQDTFFLGQAYYTSTPPDYLNCTYFTTRTAMLAPDQFKVQFQPLATYCYKKYHGGEDGYDAVKTAAQANLFPAADFAASVKAAPTPADQATAVFEADKKDDPALAKAALADREFVMSYGTAEQADAEFAGIKDKEIPVSGKVVSIADTVLTLAVSDDAKQANPATADVSVTLKEAPKTPPAVGAEVSVLGTFASYTQKPLMITMTGGEIQAKAASKSSAAPARKAPVRRR